MSNTSALMDLLFPATRRRALAVLLLRPDESFHLRELGRLAGSHPATLGREMEKLAAAGLVLRREQGNQIRYQADRSCLLFDELSSMFRKTHGVVELLREALAPLDQKLRLAVVFGSFAKGTQSARSDLDLLVVGNVGFAELVKILHPLQESLGQEINPVLYAPDEFRQRSRKGEGFLKNVAAQPTLFIKGNRDEFAELAGDPASPRPQR